MGGGGRTGVKQSSNQPLRKKIVDSEDSDEDYVAEADEVDEQSDDVVSLVGDASDEELDNRKGWRRTVVNPRPKSKSKSKPKRKPKPRVQKGVSRSRRNGVNRPKKRRKFTCDDDDDDDDDDESDDDADDDEEFKPDEFEYPDKKAVSKSGRNGENRPKKRRKFTCDDDDDSDNDADDDEEFKPDEFEYPDKKGVSKSGKNGENRPDKRRKLICNDDDDESDNDADDDEEFKPDEFEYPDQEGVSKPGRNGVNRPTNRRKPICNDDDDDSDNDADDDKEFKPDDFEYPDQEGVSKSGENGVNRSTNSDADDDSDNDAEDDKEFRPNEFEYPDEEGVSNSGRNGVNRPKKRIKFTCNDDDDDSDNDVDDDEEFTPDELEYLEEEEEEGDDDDEVEEEDEDEEDEDEELFPKINRKNRGRTTLKSKKPVKTQKKRRSKKSKRTSTSRKKANSGADKDSPENSPAPRRKRGHRKRKVTDGSDFESDACSDSSDHNFTISEEEREQIREANLFCGTVDTDLRSSRKIQDDEAIYEPKKPPVRKGKEKADEKNNDVGKPVCGICLTEEGKNTVRGTLNCCSHYFCFACIMEWSKVETRCPLCKQRFVTISKPTKCTKGVDLRNSMVAVPERDQVYQPSEEELRDFLNPYENVICTECNLGGDDALMLLCDVCDSPAHTYCVGLGREVPEGNWYCDGCRPAALASLASLSQTQPDQNSNPNSSGRLSTYENMAEIDLNVSIPETQLTQGDGGLLYSPIYSSGSLQIPSPVSGIGVSTVSGRRRIHRQIQNILSNRMSQTGGESSSPGNMSQRVNSAFHRSRSDVGTSRHPQQPVRFEENHPQSVQNTGFSPGNLMGHADASGHGRRGWGGLESKNLEPTQAQLPAEGPLGSLLPCTSRSSVGPYSAGYSSENRDVVHSNFVKHEVHSIVRNQLISMSRGLNLGHNTLTEISTSCVHTIMAAYGLEPKRHDTYGVQPPICVHLRDRLANVAVSPMNGCCLVCFQEFVKVIVERIMHISMAPHGQFFRH